MQQGIRRKSATALRRSSSGWLLLPLFALVACAPLSPDEPRIAFGTYRIPYIDGTNVVVTTDYWTHTTPKDGMYDLVSTDRLALLAAAAPGWLRQIEDANTENGAGTDNNFVWIEHPYPYCQDPTDPARSTWPGKPADYDDWCVPCNEPFCNEWTVYAHMQTDSTSGEGFLEAGLDVGDWVEAGAFIGREGDVGQAAGAHLHWHVAIIDPDAAPQNGYYDDWSDGAWYSSPELFPYMCAGVLSTVTPFVLSDGNSYQAGPCDESQRGVAPPFDGFVLR